jgi:hypothetical protein
MTHKGVSAKRNELFFGEIQNPRKAEGHLGYLCYPKAKTPEASFFEAREFLRGKSLTEIELFDEALVALASGAFEVVKQAAALGNHHQKTAAGCVVFAVLLKVVSQLHNALGQKGHLHVRTAGIFSVHLEALDFFRRRCHKFVFFRRV